LTGTKLIYLQDYTTSMNKEIQGILVFGSVLLLVLAGFYVSYISLKENLPEEERSFGNFVGNAIKGWTQKNNVNGMASCQGPVYPNLYRNGGKIVAYDQEGRPQCTPEGYTQDICAKDVNPEESADTVIKVWCSVGKIKHDSFNCPGGKTCHDGACV